MSMLINIIHPYVFKLKGDTLHGGPIEEFRERDEKISKLVSNALNKGVKVLHHRAQHPESLHGFLQDTTFESDPLFKFLFDDRISHVVTLDYGVPLPDVKPRDIKDKEWRSLSEFYTSHSELKSKVEKSNPCLFIGGVLENCLANASKYFRENFFDDETAIYYVPNVCVSLDKDLLDKVEPKLRKANIFPLNYDDALSLISN